MVCRKCSESASKCSKRGCRGARPWARFPSQGTFRKPIPRRPGQRPWTWTRAWAWAREGSRPRRANWKTVELFWVRYHGIRRCVLAELLRWVFFLLFVLGILNGGGKSFKVENCFSQCFHNNFTLSQRGNALTLSISNATKLIEKI